MPTPSVYADASNLRPSLSMSTRRYACAGDSCGEFVTRGDSVFLWQAQTPFAASVRVNGVERSVWRARRTVDFAPKGTVFHYEHRERVVLIGSLIRAYSAGSVGPADWPALFPEPRIGVIDEAICEGAVVLREIGLARSDPSSPLFASLLLDLWSRTLAVYSGRGRVQERVPQREAERKWRGVLQLVASNLDRCVGVREMADLAGYSVDHFSRLFTRDVGCTPHSYLMNVRLKRVRELLAYAELPIAEVAAMCGFCNQAHLTSQFSRTAGITPHSYRSRHVRGYAIGAAALSPSMPR